ncbi:MAG: DinB family protein [Roseiflexaceae bacterium]
MQEVHDNIRRIVEFPPQLVQVVHALPDGQVRYKPANQWSIVEHIGHLIDIDRLYLHRIELILTQEHQPFALFSIDEVHQQGHYQTRPIAELIAVLTETHNHIGHLLHGLKPDQMMRIGLDSYFGAITLAQLIEILVNHQDEHYHHICAIADYPSHNRIQG